MFNFKRLQSSNLGINAIFLGRHLIKENRSTMTLFKRFYIHFADCIFINSKKQALQFQFSSALFLCVCLFNQQITCAIGLSVAHSIVTPVSIYNIINHFRIVLTTCLLCKAYIICIDGSMAISYPGMIL